MFHSMPLLCKQATGQLVRLKLALATMAMLSSLTMKGTNFFGIPTTSRGGRGRSWEEQMHTHPSTAWREAVPSTMCAVTSRAKTYLKTDVIHEVLILIKPGVLSLWSSVYCNTFLVLVHCATLVKHILILIQDVFSYTPLVTFQYSHSKNVTILVFLQ